MEKFYFKFHRVRRVVEECVIAITAPNLQLARDRVKEGVVEHLRWDRLVMEDIEDTGIPTFLGTDDRGRGPLTTIPYLKPTGQQSSYTTLPAEERAEPEFKRPVRASYRHLLCGTTTTMGRSIAETYAIKPTFYTKTYCMECGAHYPVGPDGEFVWTDDGTKVGT